MKQLRKRVNEVDDLRDEEQQHGLAEMAEDSNHCKRHSSKITECVSYKYRGGVPVWHKNTHTHIRAGK